jgi:hypothetical protein
LRPRSASSTTSPRKVKSFSFVRSSNQARCSPAIAFGLCPPVCSGATLPVCRNRRTQRMAVLTPTPNCAAARWQTCRPSQPLRLPAREDRWNKVCPSMLASFPASMLNQNPESNQPNLTPLQLGSARVGERTRLLQVAAPQHWFQADCPNSPCRVSKKTAPARAGH